MATYLPTPKEVQEQVQLAMTRYHSDLASAGVTVLTLFAHAKVDEKSGELIGCALKHNGYPALALVRITDLKDRVAGMPDCRILLDGDLWPEKSAKEQMAILDHELEHVKLVRDKEGKIKYDAADRPKLKLKPHDAQIGVFYDVVERHGKDAIEAQAYIEVNRKMTQLKFPWG